MSTYWYFECLDHDPAMRADDEFTQHTDDYAFKRAVELAGQRPIAEDNGAGYFLDSVDTYFEKAALRFLVKHPTCNLELVSEYGDRRSLEATP